MERDKKKKKRKITSLAKTQRVLLFFPLQTFILIYIQRQRKKGVHCSELDIKYETGTGVKHYKAIIVC